jgi:hypothetical protein
MRWKKKTLNAHNCTSPARTGEVTVTPQSQTA